MLLRLKNVVSFIGGGGVLLGVGWAALSARLALNLNVLLDDRRKLFFVYFGPDDEFML